MMHDAPPLSPPSPSLDLQYQACLLRLKTLKKSAGSPSELSACTTELKEITKRLYKQRHNPTPVADADPERAHATYPEPFEIPLDKDGFSTSFPCPSSPLPTSPLPSSKTAPPSPAQAFFAAHGYVVFRGALSPSRCALTRSEIWASQEAAIPNLDRNEPETYDLMSSETYGLAPSAAVFTPEIVQNRQSPAIIGALAHILNASPSDILTSQDRWCCYRPTRDLPPPLGHKPEWKTRGNLHLDLHPWHFAKSSPQHGTDINSLTFDQLRDFSREINMAHEDEDLDGAQIQGVLALSDSRCLESFGDGAEDGGTLLVPNFHIYFPKWREALGAVEGHRRGGEERNFIVEREGGGASYKFADTDKIHELARRVPVREGDLLVWDQVGRAKRSWQSGVENRL